MGFFNELSSWITVAPTQVPVPAKGEKKELPLAKDPGVVIPFAIGLLGLLFLLLLVVGSVRSAQGAREGGWLDFDCPTPRKVATVLEFVYSGILVLAFAFIAWFAGYVVYKLYQGQR